MPLWYFTTANFACILFTSGIAIAALLGIPFVFWLSGLSVWSIGYTVIAIPCGLLLIREDRRDFCKDRQRIQDLKEVPYFTQF